MTWNHRVVIMRDASAEGGYTMGICEVYYNDEGKPYMRNHGATVFGETTEELQRVLDQMRRATELPALDDEQYFTEDSE